MRQELVDLGFQFLGEVLQLRPEARLQSLAGPDQLAAEGREARPTSLLAFDQRHFEKGGPFFDQIPGVPIGHVRPVRGLADLAGHPDFIEEIQPDQDRLRIGVPPETPYRLDLDANQGALPIGLLLDGFTQSSELEEP